LERPKKNRRGKRWAEGRLTATGHSSSSQAWTVIRKKMGYPRKGKEDRA